MLTGRLWLGWETADQGEKGSWAQAMGNHVVWKEKPLSSMKKWIVGSCNGKSRGLEGETAEQYEKRDRGLG